MKRLKILMVDTAVTGHHLFYMNELLENLDFEFILMLPQKNTSFNGKQFIYCADFKKKSFKIYYDWITRIKKIAYDNKVDIIHILNGDVLYRSFGLGIKTIKKPIIVTFHHMKFGFLMRRSLKCIYKQISDGVVHTDQLYSQLKKQGIHNCKKIDYPSLLKGEPENKEALVKKYNIDDKKKIILFMGATRFEKGLDILVNAVNKLKTPFCLVIAGQEKDITEEYVKNNFKSTVGSLAIKMGYVSDRDMNGLYKIADIVVLPYRRTFDGASGPLCDAVFWGVPIIGPNHGSLGDIIVSKHIGLTFKTEDAFSLSQAIEQLLIHDFCYDQKALDFKKRLSPEIFIQEYLDLIEGSI